MDIENGSTSRNDYLCLKSGLQVGIIRGVWGRDDFVGKEKSGKIKLKNKEKET